MTADIQLSVCRAVSKKKPQGYEQILMTFSGHVDRPRKMVAFW